MAPLESLFKRLCRINNKNERTSVKPESNETIREQLELWQLSFNYHHRKPIMGYYTINFIKLMCDSLLQSFEVFLMSVELMEDFLHKSNPTANFKEDVLAIATSILISSKSYGQRPEINLRLIQQTIAKLTDVYIRKEQIRNEEIKFLTTVKRIPSLTLLTDVNMFANYFAANHKVGVPFEAIAIEIITIFYLCKRDICSKLEKVLGVEYFSRLVSNKFLVTCGVVLCTLQFIAPKNSINVTKVATNFEGITSIPRDVLLLLVQILNDYL